MPINAKNISLKVFKLMLLFLYCSLLQLTVLSKTNAITNYIQSNHPLASGSIENNKKTDSFLQLLCISVIIKLNYSPLSCKYVLLQKDVLIITYYGTSQFIYLNKQFLKKDVFVVFTLNSIVIDHTQNNTD